MPKCCWARIVVGTSIITCLPSAAALTAARSATSVLPKPTSPQTSRSIGRSRLHVALDRLDRLDLVGGLAVGEGRLHRDLPLAVGREGVAAAGAALGVEVEQLAGQRAGGAAGPRLHVLPALAAERRERRLAAGADVAAQLRQLVGGDVDAVLALVFEVEVVAGDAADLAGLEAGEAGDAVVLVDDVVADPQLAEGEAAAAGAGRRLLGARRRWTRRRKG